jgi:methylenetetrahydrofolate dehydrogenase (NADP+)/methenyltetrahydrofolate cyclohydrolase
MEKKYARHSLFMRTEIFDDKKIKEVHQRLAKEIAGYKAKPKLAVILVGKDLASEIYVKKKKEACQELGIISQVFRLPEDSKEIVALDLIKKLNRDNTVHGILVQLPLPKHFNVESIMTAISTKKDVDGLNPLNMGKLSLGNEMLVPCTPKGVIRILEQTGIGVKGKDVVIVNNSNIIGKPLALMLLNRNATVDICCKETKNLTTHTKKADILVVAVGIPRLIRGDMIKEGAVIIDVGTNRINGKVCGDVDFEEVKGKASFITPVPGGVGPMTIAMLMENTISCYKNLIRE